MDKIHSGPINDFATKINSGINYLKGNAMPIVILLGIIYYVKSKVIKAGGASSFIKSKKSNPNRTKNLNEDMRRVRLQQQEIAMERAKVAAVERKAEEAEKKKKKNLKTHGTSSSKGDGTKLGKADYNPMQPWSSNTRGYRPARRNANRGG